MLLIGSRAICYHIPEFRKPVDWDLIGSREEQALIASRLPLDPKGTQSEKKTHYRYGDSFVEFAVREELPYWDQVCRDFENEPTLTDPVLGEMRIPPVEFLFLIKQAGLIYRIKYWHKNLEDIYFLRSRIRRIPDRIASMLAAAQENSRSVYGAGHDRLAIEPFACHPKMPRHPRPDVHKILHERLKIGSRPMVAEEGAWEGFPRVAQPERTEKMIRLFAEEAMVLGGHHFLESSPHGGRSGLRSAPEIKRYALRALITSCLPPAWRYFGVNYYREIAELIPENFYDHLEGLEALRPQNIAECVSDGTAFSSEAWDVDSASGKNAS